MPKQQRGRKYFKKNHPYYPPFSSTGLPRLETAENEWARLDQDDFSRVAKHSTEGDTYSLCDADGRAGSKKLLRPKKSQREKAVERFSKNQQGAQNQEMKPIHIEKCLEMFNRATVAHANHEGSCDLPNFAVNRTVPKGLCCKMSLKCTKCSFVGSQHKLYEEVQREKVRGAKAAKPNAALGIAAQETSVGNKGLRKMLACAHITPPAASGMQSLAQKVCTQAAVTNEDDLRRRRRETRAINRLRGLPEDAPINSSFDARYNSTVIGSRSKAGQNASQAIALVIENQTDQKQILGAALENKLCMKGPHIRRKKKAKKGKKKAKKGKKKANKKDEGVTSCPDHHGCTATLAASEPLSERRLGERLGEQFAQDNVPLKYLTTDGDARGAEGMEEGMKGYIRRKKLKRKVELHRKADPIHIGVAQMKEVNKTAFSQEMFPGATRDVQKDQQREFAKDLKGRCYAIWKQLGSDCGGDVKKMNAKVPGIIETTLDCYSGDCSKCRRISIVCRGGKTKNWWARSKHLTGQLMGQERHFNMTEADRKVLREIMLMLLGEATLCLLDNFTNTCKNEACNRALSVTLPKSVNYARQAYNRMHSTVHRMNHGPGESCLLKLEAAGCAPSFGSKPALFFCRDQEQWQRAQKHSKSRKRKLERTLAERRQRSSHYVGKAARKTRDKYRKHQLDPKRQQRPEKQAEKRQREQRRRLREVRAEAREENKEIKRPRRSSRQAQKLAPKPHYPRKADHTYSR